MPLSKVEKKRLYDVEYRRLNRDKMKKRQAEYHQRTYDPIKARVERKKTMARHIEYCRQPKYKEWKKEYDKNREFGEYRECYELAMEIIKIVRKYYPSKYERLKARGYQFNKLRTRQRI